MRCRDFAIGYPERQIAAEINLDIDHGSRAAIVGDNGQGKTTFLRSVVDSLPPLAGEIRWGYGCQIGIYAQHVYTSLPQDQTVLDYLEYNSAAGTKNASDSRSGRRDAVSRRAGQEANRGAFRRRAGPALPRGLLLSQYNVLVLDEPGNHLDVDTVEALAEALVEYKGTVIFTSHDRHFLKRVASCIIEVRDGHVTNYNGQYDAYLYSVNKEIDEGEREQATRLAKPAPSVGARRKRRRDRQSERSRGSQGDRHIGAIDRAARRAEAADQRPIPHRHRSGRFAAIAQGTERP